MVNGYESMEADDDVDDTSDANPETVSHETRKPGIPEGTNEDTPKSTTIGTIALQSGETRLVIALLEVRAIDD